MKSKIWILVTVLILAFPVASKNSTEAANVNVVSVEYRVVGQIGGLTQAVAIQGNYAYVGVGLRLVVLDVSNSKPTEVGNTSPFPYSVEDVVVSESRAYVAAGGAGLRVVNISNPANPTELGSWDSPGYAEGVAVAGNIVYLADGPYGLRVVDVSDPVHPTPVGSTYDMSYAFEVAMSGNYAYIAAAGRGLLVADVSDPAHPVEVGAFDTPGYAYGVAVAGNQAYVADAWEGLRVVDVANPANLIELGACDTPGWVLNVAIAGSKAYLADGAGGLRVVDVSTPSNPSEIGAYEEFGFARRIAISGDRAYLADLHKGLLLVNVQNPANPTQVSQYSPMAEARRVAVSGKYAYVAAGFGGLRIVDLSDPGHPVEVGMYDITPGYAESIVVSNTLAYIASGVTDSLHIINVADPGHPSRVGFIPSQNIGPFRDITLSGNTLYAADEFGLRIYDVSDPSTPIQLGFIQLNENNQGTIAVAVSGAFAYVADTGNKVRIVNVSNPYNPTLASNCCSNWHWVNGAAVSGNKLYAAVHSAGLHIADVSDPYHPFEIGSYDTPGVAQSVAVSGTEAYVSDSGGGLTVVDASNPAVPTWITSYDTPGRTGHTALGDDYVYLTDGHAGLLILEKTSGNAVSRFEPRPTYPASPDVPAPVGMPQPGVLTSDRIAVGNPVSSPPAADPLATTYLVTSALDSGPGTLRQALLDAGPGDTIIFDPAIFPPLNPATITLESELPPVIQGHLTIDGNAGVVLDGRNLLADFVGGLQISSDYNTVRGLYIVNFDDYGLGIATSHNLAEGNVFGGNGAGISIGGEDNVVIGNLVGVDEKDKIISNEIGIQLCCAAKNNQIGGTAPGGKNIISGNTDAGVIIGNRNTVGNVVIGNYIGTDFSGTKAIGNGWGGLYIWDGPCGNTVTDNLISGNPGVAGVLIGGTDANHNEVIGNKIGTDASGMFALGNQSGILLCGAGYNRVEGNLISGNTFGVSICEGSWPHSLIRSNLIGTNINGTGTIGNGIGIYTLGWHMLFEKNVIAGSNQGPGVDVSAAGTEYNMMFGNFIGTDATGTLPLGNHDMGVRVWDYAAHTFIQGNTIAFNLGGWGNGGGVYVERSLFNVIRRNSIYSHPGRGIVLGEGGNHMLLAPVILTATETSASGTACPGCTVEVFSDAADEGRVYEGSTMVNGTGVFTFSKGSPLTGLYLTTTATDQNGNTSEFSQPHFVGGQIKIYLPILLKGR